MATRWPPPPHARRPRSASCLAFGTYSWDEERGSHLPTVLQVITLNGTRIEEITGFVSPEVFGGFGLPSELAV